ncbi:lysis system i-spanin subunit Rz [Providencia manganoxydans]|uniref:lysis system i-spanin subunit Rz n=1 Tax=Providencia manganoxydans TaxID=2923283 RepID=UPI0034E58227
MSRYSLLAYFIFVLFSIGGAFSISRMAYQSQLNSIKLGHQMALNAIAVQAFLDSSEKLARLHRAQQTLHELNQTFDERLANEKHESQRLRDDLLVERRRVQFASADLATCQLIRTDIASAGSVGDVATVGLTAKAGLLVHDIRTGIQQDHNKIAYLQGYIRDVVKQCKVKE